MISDPIIGKMLTQDNNIPDPYRPIGYNCYDYAFNNPLLYVDPAGNTFHSAAEFWQTLNDLQNSGYGTYFQSDADVFDAEATIIAADNTWGVKRYSPVFCRCTRRLL